MKPLDQIVTKLNALADLNILDNSRQRQYIDARAVFCVIAYRYVGLTLSQVAQYFKDRGKNSDHATILHAVKNYEIYSKYNPKLNLWLSDIICNTDLKVTSKKEIMIHKITQMNENNIDLLEKPIEIIYSKNIKENQETNEN
jgi:hypothetical protein